MWLRWCGCGGLRTIDGCFGPVVRFCQEVGCTDSDKGHDDESGMLKQNSAQKAPGDALFHCSKGE